MQNLYQTAKGFFTKNPFTNKQVATRNSMGIGLMLSTLSIQKEPISIVDLKSENIKGTND